MILPVVHERRELPERVIRRELGQLLLRDDAVGEEVLDLLADGLRLLVGRALAALRVARSAARASRTACFWAAVMVPLATRLSSASESAVSSRAGLVFFAPGEGAALGEAAAGGWTTDPTERGPPEVARTAPAATTSMTAASGTTSVDL